MHRNAEIWEKRHERLGRIERKNTAELRTVLEIAGPEAEREIRVTASIWAERFNALERRVWHALCVAKGWRRA